MPSEHAPELAADLPSFLADKTPSSAALTIVSSGPEALRRGSGNARRFAGWAHEAAQYTAAPNPPTADSNSSRRRPGSRQGGHRPRRSFPMAPSNRSFAAAMHAISSTGCPVNGASAARMRQRTRARSSPASCLAVPSSHRCSRRAAGCDPATGRPGAQNTRGARSSSSDVIRSRKGARLPSRHPGQRPGLSLRTARAYSARAWRSQAACRIPWRRRTRRAVRM